MFSPVGSSSKPVSTGTHRVRRAYRLLPIPPPLTAAHRIPAVVSLVALPMDPKDVRPLKSLPPAEDESPSTRDAWLEWGGGVLGAAVVASWSTAFPVAARLARLPGGRTKTFPALGALWGTTAGLLLIPMVMAVVVVVGARRGLRTMGGPGTNERALATAYGVSVLVGLQGIWAGVLRRHTHHKALAGVTFAVGSMGIAVVLFAMAFRGMAWLRGLSPAELRRSWFLILAGSALLVAYLAREVVRADAFSSVGGMTEVAIDVLAGFIVTLVVSSRDVVNHPRLRKAGPWLVALTLVAAFTSFRLSPSVAQTVAELVGRR